MNPLVRRRHAAAWTLRGVLCALPSAYWALLEGFRCGAELLGMAAGVATAVAAFAVLTRGGAEDAGGFARAVMRAANLRAALAALGCAGLAFPPLVALLVPDVYGGALALAVMKRLGRASGWHTGPSADSFWVTYATTLLQGVAVALTICALAVAIHVVSRVARGAARA
jgi:hypothetical protein